MTEPKAIPCINFCFGGYKGNQVCNNCEGTGSVFAIQDNGDRWHYLPNTKIGYETALLMIKDKS